MTIRAYPMAARQASFVTDRGDEVTMRLMMKTDKDALLDFLRRNLGQVSRQGYRFQRSK